MSDYIKREDVREGFNTANECGECSRNLDNCFGCVIAINIVCDVIDKIPSADVVERKRGAWEYHSNPNNQSYINPEDAYCSNCGCHIDTTMVEFDDYNYCPNCGADMRAQEAKSCVTK